MRPELSQDGLIQIKTWASELLNFGGRLQERQVIHPSINIKAGVMAWLEDDQHGAVHSFMVYRGAAEKIAPYELGRLLDTIEDRKLQWLAAGHDLVRFFPGVNYQTGLPISDWQTTAMSKHALRAGWLMRQLGGDLGFTSEESLQLAQDLAYHDFSLENIKGERRARILLKLSSLGRIFHDADKLFALGLTDNAGELVRNVLERNRLGGFRTEGWYLLRPDLTDRERDEWQYGDRWFSDRVAAIRKEIFGSKMLTQIGRKIASARQEVFAEVGAQVFGAEFNRQLKIVKRWETHFSDHSIQIEFVGKNYPSQNFEASDLETVYSLIVAAMNAIVPVSGEIGFGRIPKGIMIMVTCGGKKELIDPTIARFVFQKDNNNDKISFNNSQGKDLFLTAINKAVIPEGK